MQCIKCNKYDKKAEFCMANLFLDEVGIECILKQILQELRFDNDDEDNEEWKGKETK